MKTQKLHPDSEQVDRKPTPAVIARIGMRVDIPSLDNHGPHAGTIVAMFDDACIVRLDEPRDTSDGDAPNVAALEWDRVNLTGVLPDLEPAGVPSARTTPRAGPAKGVYCAETRQWMTVFPPDSPRTFHIYKDDDKAAGNIGPRIATVTLNVAMDDESARNLASLIEHTPQLWREFRDMNRYLLIEQDDVQTDIFASTTKLLASAAGRAPYGPAIDPVDEDVCRRLSDRTVGRVGGSQGVDRA